MEDISTLIDLRHIEEVAASHPLLRGLLRDVPPAHSVWPKAQQEQWLTLAASIFAVLYEEKPREELPEKVSRSGCGDPSE
jgi:hypothetical protein